MIINNIIFQASNNIFVELELFLKEKIPQDIVLILERSGFNSAVSLGFLNDESIAEIEKYANEDRSVLGSTSYEKVKLFKFKPGHKVFLQNLSKQVDAWKESKCDENLESKRSFFSQVLQAFIECAESNSGREPKGHRYNEINRYFSTFIYLMCGKACYETLSANLPIPKADTIRMYIFDFFTNNILNYCAT